MKEGETYIIYATIILGFSRGSVKLVPVKIKDLELFYRTRNAIVNNHVMIPNEKKFNKTNLKLAKTITREMNDYKSKKVTDENIFSIISPDMAIPKDSLK